MSLNYSDRIQNAINFSFFKAQDTDKLLLDAIDPTLRRRVDPKNQKTLPKIYQALFQNPLPENPPSCFQTPRKRGNATITPLDRYESFFSSYTKTTLTSNKSREKLLQMCIVLQLGADQTEEILKKVGCQGLYAASLFENCIWYILKTNGTLYDLYTLYDEALSVASDSRVNPNSIYEQDATSRSRLNTSLFISARTDQLPSSKELNKDSFLTFISTMGSYFRYHRESVSEKYTSLIDSINCSSMYNFFSPCLKDTQPSFLEQFRLFDTQEIHLKHPSREIMILIEMYYRMKCNSLRSKVHSFVASDILNKMLQCCGYPQLNAKFPFDHVIMEMLEYLPNGKDDQLTMVGRLLPLYQFAFDCKSLQGEYQLPDSVLDEVVGAFDKLLHIEYDTTHFNFLTSCQLLGRSAYQNPDYKVDAPYFIPCRELVILLKLLEDLITRNKAPSVEELNRLLSRIAFHPLLSEPASYDFDQPASYDFDQWIQALISLPKLEDILLRLRPFFHFIMSFKQLSNAPHSYCNQAFSDFYQQVNRINKADHMPTLSNAERAAIIKEADSTFLSKSKWTTVVSNLFSYMEKLSCNSKVHTKLLDCQVSVQTMFSYLEIQLFPCKSSLESATLSIESQNKYEPRKWEKQKKPKKPKKPTNKPWVNKFYNLHYGEYTVKFSCTLNGQSWQFSHQVKLSPAEPSLTLHFSPENSQVKVYQEKTETRKDEMSGVKQSVDILKHLETISLFPPKKCP